MKHPFLAALVTVAWLVAGGAGRGADRRRATCTTARSRRSAPSATRPQSRRSRRCAASVAAYEAVVRAHPASGYCDNALWQAANLASLAFERFGDEADRKTVRPAPDAAGEGISRPASSSRAGAPRAAWRRIASDRSQLAPPRPHRPRRHRASDPPAPVDRPTDPDDSGRRDAAGDQADGAAGRHPAHRGPRRRGRLPPGRDRQPAAAVLRSQGREDRAEAAGRVAEVRRRRGEGSPAGPASAATRRASSSISRGLSGYTVYPLYGPYRLVIDFRRAVATTPSAATHGRRRRPWSCRRRCPRRGPRPRSRSCPRSSSRSRRRGRRRSPLRCRRSRPSPKALPPGRAGLELERQVLAVAAARASASRASSSTPVTAATIPARTATASRSPS